MRLREEQIARLAEKILEDLNKAGLISLKKERGASLPPLNPPLPTTSRVKKPLPGTPKNFSTRPSPPWGGTLASIGRKC